MRGAPTLSGKERNNAPWIPGGSAVGDGVEEIIEAVMTHTILHVGIDLTKLKFDVALLNAGIKVLYRTPSFHIAGPSTPLAGWMPPKFLPR